MADHHIPLKVEGDRVTGIRKIAAPPCEQSYPTNYAHPRFPSGDCVVCGALCTEGCKHPDYEAWEAEQTS